MATKYVLVDFENVQPKDVTSLNGSSALQVKVFLGSNQTKMPTATAITLQPLGSDVEYIRIDGNGKNALDFHIAYYMGRLVAQTPDADFLVISNDTGFDPLIKHLNQLGVRCRRSTTVAEAPAASAPVAATAAGQHAEAAIEYLVKQKAARPRTLKSLRSAFKAFFVNQLSEEAIEHVIDQLSKRKVIRIADGRVQYQLI